MTFYAVEGQAAAEPASQPRTHRARVSAGYFSNLGAAVQEGRELTSEDRPESLPVVVVNESFARRAWPGASPLNRRIRLGRGNDEPWRTVVGVVPDLWMNGLDRSTRPDGIYLPLAQAPAAGFRLVVRAAGDPVALTPSIRQRVAQLDRGLPLDSVQTMERVVSRNTFAFNMFGALFGLFGLAALLLASVGIYGVVAFSVQQRTREIGIRISLGAQRRDILSLLLGQGARQVAAGLGVGLLLAWGVSRLIGSFLFEVQPGDPAVFLSVTLLLAGVALCACLVPARRAMRVDPQVSLRYE
jgi:putative ABC transport system permease protein